MPEEDIFKTPPSESDVSRGMLRQMALDVRAIKAGMYGSDPNRPEEGLIHRVAALEAMGVELKEDIARINPAQVANLAKAERTRKQLLHGGLMAAAGAAGAWIVSVVTTGKSPP